MDKDLSALVFELQRAGSKVDKAKALARAWRTIRGLNAAERRLLAREVGFDGAEDLVEGLAGRGHGVFAPAAVLEALGKMRRQEGLSVRGILSDLRDPDRRDDLLVRGIDLMAESVSGSDVEEPPDGGLHEVDETSLHDPDVRLTEAETGEWAEGDGVAEDEIVSPPPVPDPLPEPEREPEPQPEPDHDVAPPPDSVDPSSWDEMWSGPKSLEATSPPPRRILHSRAADEPHEPVQTTNSVLTRLQAFRVSIPELKRATEGEIRGALEDLPEPWARRRALVALIEADVPDRAADALDLIEDLERPMDRRWCLSTLARRGDLASADLDRALAMLDSPAARRKVQAQARIASSA